MLTGVAIVPTPRDRAAVLKGFKQYSAKVAADGLNTKATSEACGAISLRNPGHLPAIELLECWFRNDSGFFAKIDSSA